MDVSRDKLSWGAWVIIEADSREWHTTACISDLKIFESQILII